ncbi:MAG: hypothetical protein A2270_07925 [Elusimicrobia bacterium RIFOXYA12_FULL_51_18]|nr:MAG: hypothetical protein A2270_07925 [Elusimicrobia bacterium RIFOXYA12_FULL_51_18]
MPFGDGTGPMGTGPIGGGRGTCGRGGAWRRGGGYSRGIGLGGVLGRSSSPVSEKELIASETQALKTRLSKLEKRMGEIKGEGK